MVRMRLKTREWMLCYRGLAALLLFAGILLLVLAVVACPGCGVPLAG